MKSSRDTLFINPSFDIPDGVEEMVVDTEVLPILEDDSPDPSTVPDGGLEVPDYIEIIEQIVHINADGSKTIDVVIEVEDIGGLVQYDVRLTKE